MWINLVEYFSKNPVKTSISSQKKKTVVVRTFPENPDSETYCLHCKSQLIKFKSWSTCPQDKWSYLDESDIRHAKEWKHLLETDISNKPVHNWKGSVDDTFKFLSHDELRDDKETVNESQQCKELMYIARIVGPPQGNHSVGCDNWDQMSKLL